MFTEDYLMRIINQALATLMNAIGLKKAGKNSEALQALQQAIEQLTGFQPDFLDQMDDASILSMLTTQEKLDAGRLTILADIYLEQGELLLILEHPAKASLAFSRAMRFHLETLLADESSFSPESLEKIGTLARRLNQDLLPIDTLLALFNYYLRLLEMDDQALAASGDSRDQIEQALVRLKERIDSSTNPIGD